MRTIKEFYLKHKRIKISDSAASHAGKQLTTPELVVNIARNLIGDSEQEHFLVFMLDSQNCVLGFHEAGRGSVDFCPASPVTIFRTAVFLGASAIIITHNHPSGVPKPSFEDITLTNRIKKCAELLNINLLDHVIVSTDDYISFADRGLL